MAQNVNARETRADLFSYGVHFVEFDRFPFNYFIFAVLIRKQLEKY